ncbi:hypothetical protein BJ992_002694 [Sphaerisporangium rubeum]|uniref:Uncharacterized protein n=1 Tax=Sphaerisporangium rubeum TaxID=321317 RepID=A0A7X0IFX6_9ACTN|nr:hypothetical protein [Sphaerisporangium rubeum]
MPTPLASMQGPSRREISQGNPKHRLETAVALLPTPKATDGTNGGPNQRGSSGDLTLPSLAIRLPTGDPTAPPYTAGNTSSAAPPPGPPNPGEPATA